MTESELLERLGIGEDQDVEFKSAEGGFPKAAWETISGFANTEGGYIVLGVREQKRRFEAQGLRNPDGVLKTFWDGHNNRQCLSTPLCNAADASVTPISGRRVVVIRVPRAGRTQRPVFIGGNPYTGTYKRNYTGDYRCTEAEVRQMLRDAGDEPQDAHIWEHFGLGDLDSDTLKAFRNRFASREPDHPFLAYDDQRLLTQLGGWRRDRATGREGLTLAGLLMFGCERSLLDALPHYHLDYQEKLSDDPEERWSYRLTLDGRWQPNLFNFYYRVYPRLVDGLGVPFRLDNESVRVGETHVHQALREALVNTLIHADYLASRGIAVVKQTDTFVFLNPGRLRIPIERLYEGGISDPRNPSLQKMFQMLGLGEKSGSGFPKILRAWREQHWVIPLVSEKLDLEMTALTLPLVSLIPEDVERALREVVGDAYPSLTELDRIILLLAHRFEEICNSDIQPYRREHPREIGERLKYLVEHGWLKSSGRGRGTKYRLPREAADDLFSPRRSGRKGGSLQSEAGSEHYRASSEHYEAGSEHYDAELLKIATPVRGKGRVNKELLERTIVKLCSEHFLSLRELSDLLDRSPDTVRTHYLNRMVQEGTLELRIPQHPNHPKQAYRATAQPADT